MPTRQPESETINVPHPEIPKSWTDSRARGYRDAFRIRKLVLGNTFSLDFPSALASSRLQFTGSSRWANGKHNHQWQDNEFLL
jgi:hypothetical protein